MGCYQEGIAKDSVGGKDVTAHIFECVTRTIYEHYLIPVGQIYVERRRFRNRRSDERGVPCSDHLLLEGTKQEEAQ